MSENKTCKQCQKDFVVEDEDLEFYKKISPIFAAKTFEIPAPTLCPECRQQRRTAWRNERNLYKRTCDLCGKNIVALYEQDSPFTVYCQECFWSDKWDPQDFASDYDASQSFIKQIKEVQKKAPRLALLNTRSENSQFSNHSSQNKDCYLVFGSFNNERVMYCRKTRESKDVLDCNTCFNGSELCYECFFIETCYNLKYSIECKNCSNSNFLFDCIGCKDCYMCYGLRNKQYCFENEQLSKEEYEKKIPNLGSRKIINEQKERFHEFINNAIHKYARFMNCENCTGDDLMNCKDCRMTFDVENSEGGKYFELGEYFKDCADCFGAGLAENLYEVHGLKDGYNCAFIHASYHNSRVYYADNCHNCQDIFGCVSMKKAQYCILDKQYTREEYEKKVAEILEKMNADGEWGEFFPIGMSPFAYNETIAMEYFPLDEVGVEKIGANWREIKHEIINVETIVPHDDIEKYVNSDAEVNKLLAGAIKCEVTGIPFRIMPQEMAFYLKNKVPVPTIHYNQRHAERQKNVNPRKLNHRQCMCEESGHDHSGRCPNEFKTTYAPERPEKVYCESCYQKTVL